MSSDRKRALIVDGHEEVLLSLEKLLEDAGFHTTAAWSAHEAKRLLRAQRFEVVLSSEYLPDGGCEDLLRAGRKDRDGVRLIILQASSPLVDDPERWIFSGAFAAVCKYDKLAVVSAVKAACSLSEHAAQSSSGR